MKTCIAQFVKSPEYDQVKTRLQPPLSGAQAKQLHVNLARYVARETWQFCLANPALAAMEIWSSAGGAFAENLSQQFNLDHHRQKGANLGERLSTALDSALTRADAVVFIGSDCPFIDSDYLSVALRKLSQVDVVIGPACDGGYVLLGMKKPTPSVFEGIEWGSEKVFAQTVAKIEQLGLSFEILGELADIDRPEDLELLKASATCHLLKGL